MWRSDVMKAIARLRETSISGHGLLDGSPRGMLPSMSPAPLLQRLELTGSRIG